MQRVLPATAILTLALMSTACTAVGSDRPGAARSLGIRTTLVAATPLPRFDDDRAMNHVRRLANGIGVRVRGTSGELRGSHYIAGKFRAFGYNVRIKKFKVDGRRSRNVIATAPDVVDHPFIIGAHMDSVPGSPGANDNASGVAVVIETARMVRDTPKAKLLKFIAFGSEEFGSNGKHHVGSNVFVASRTQEARNKMPGMLSVDMVADGRPLLIGTSGIGPEVASRMIHRKVRDAGISSSYRTLCDCSDNGPFERAGIPAAFMWSDYEPDYHSPSDTPPNMVKAHLDRSGRAVRAFVRALNTWWLEHFRQF